MCWSIRQELSETIPISIDTTLSEVAKVVTPDSFSDGGKYTEIDKAVAQATLINDISAGQRKEL